MQDKTRCVCSILLSVFPFLVCGALMGLQFLSFYAVRIPNFLFAVLSLPIFSESNSLLLFPIYAFLTAVSAWGMQCFAESNFSPKQEKIYLAFPLSAGACGVLGVTALYVPSGLAGYILFCFLGATALLCWCVWNSVTLAVIRKSEKTSV
ncbi:MAG: hypothetical protein ACI4K6_02570 [Candidatus Fimenecus sp.]